MIKSKQSTKKNIVSTKDERKSFLIWSILIPVLLLLIVGLWYYRVGVKYYFSVLIRKEIVESYTTKEHDSRNIFLISQHEDYVFGIDVSQYQGKILWDSIQTIYDRFPIDFIFVRATMGAQSVDRDYQKNWKSALRLNKLRGAYHYYRPNENSIKQAQNFIRKVKLEAGDLPPVLDIEEHPRSQPMDSLRVGLQRWLSLIEDHYDVKPILYSGDSYYTDFLQREFGDYVLWIANYNFWVKSPKDHWDFWQFSEKGSVNGISGPVDLNMYKGNIRELESLTVPYDR